MSRPKFALNNINTDDCPCKDCTPDKGKRHSGCHGTCEEYITWDADHQQKLAQRQHIRDMDDVYYSGMFRRNKQLHQKGI